MKTLKIVLCATTFALSGAAAATMQEQATRLAPGTVRDVLALPAVCKRDVLYNLRQADGARPAGLYRGDATGACVAAASSSSVNPASTTVQGTTAMSAVPALASNPISVGTNDTRMSSSTLGRIVVAEQFAGADVGAKINAADTALGSAQGEIQVYESGNIATPIIVSSNHTLRFKGGSFTASNAGTVIALKDNSALACDNWGTTLRESTGAVDFRGNSPWAIVSAYENTISASATARNITVRGCHFAAGRSDYNSAVPTLGLGNCQNCEVASNWLESTHGIGILVGSGSGSASYAQGFSVHDNLDTGGFQQRISVVNADGVLIANNQIRYYNPGAQPSGAPIDVEPNNGQRIKNVVISGNYLNFAASPNVVNSAISLNNTVPSTITWENVVVRDNTIIGGTGTGNAVLYGIYVTNLQRRTIIKDNFLAHINNDGIIIEGTNGVLVTGNRFVSVSEGGARPIHINNSSYCLVTRNEMYQGRDQAGALDTYAGQTAIIETGTSNNNTFIENTGEDGVVILGAASRLVSHLYPGAARFQIGGGGLRFADGTTQTTAATAGAPTAWTDLTLLNSWTNYGAGYQSLQWRRNGDLCEVRGVIAGGAIGTLPFAQLPSNCRPPAKILFVSITNTGAGQAEVDTSGYLYPESGGNTYFSFTTTFSTLP